MTDTTEEATKKSEGSGSGDGAGAAVQIYARLRMLMPWEPKKISVKVLDDNTVQNKTEKTTNEYTFQHVFNMGKSNEDLFKVMCKPLIRRVLEGYNAVLIAYGQTGSGKTHTLLGKSEQNVKGVLPLSLEALLEAPTVKSIEVSGVEAYGTHVSRIELFDLFNEANKDNDWSKKAGNSQLQPKLCTSKTVTNLKECWDRINEAHDSSHFAPTGKNPESSRGHAAFVAKVTQDVNGETLTSYFVVVDLAGSEGESAFTPEFVRKVDKATLMARRLEAGCINNGLSQLQVVFNELRVKGKLSKVEGTGLRRILHSYINAQCVISVLFTLSPSENNAITTASTLKFAVQAGMVKVKPVKSKTEVNYKQLVEQLKEHIEDQKNLIEKLNDTIEEIRDKYEDLRAEHERLVNMAKDTGKHNAQALEVKKNSFLQRATIMKRQETKMGKGLLNNLELFDKEHKDNDEDELTEDGVLVCWLDEAAVDKKIVDHSRERSVMDSNLVTKHLNLSKMKLDIPDDLEDEETETKTQHEKIAHSPAAAPTANRFAAAFHANPHHKHEDLGSIKASVEIHQKPSSATTTPATPASEPTMEMVGSGIEFKHADTTKMNRQDLLDYCDSLESIMIEEKSLRGALEQSQKVIIDHLMETNEGLLRWFQMKKIL